MTRYEHIRSLSIEGMADGIIDFGFMSDYCKSDCDPDDHDDCPHERDCVLRYLAEEVEP